MSQEDELAPCILQGVSVCKERGQSSCGSYRFVFEVKVGKTVYIAKKPHSYFLCKTSDQEKTAVILKFRAECLLLSKLRHPNIVQFIGVHYGPSGRDDVSLVMEKLVCDLSAFLERNRDVEKLTKIMILQDVSYGLVYLHEYNPTIIHRDLTARNILLTPDCRAKIADVGMAKMMDERTRQAEIQTQIPGQVYYMPPEARKRKANYTSKLDMFSFGHLSLHTVLGEYPTLFEDDITPEILQQGTSEITKRQISLDKCRSGRLDCLYPSIVSCLMDNPERRPTAHEMNTKLNNIVLEFSQHEEEFSLLVEKRALKAQLRAKNEEVTGIKGSMQGIKKERDQLQKLVEHTRNSLLSQEKDLMDARKQLNETLAQLEQERNLLAAMDREKRSLQDEVSVHQARAKIFEEDFLQERKDREQAHSKSMEKDERYKHQLDALGMEAQKLMEELKRQKKMYQDLKNENQARLSQRTYTVGRRERRMTMPKDWIGEKTGMFEPDFLQERKDRDQAHSKSQEKHQLQAESQKMMEELKTQKKINKDMESDYEARLSQHEARLSQQNHETAEKDRKVAMLEKKIEELKISASHSCNSVMTQTREEDLLSVMPSSQCVAPSSPQVQESSPFKSSIHTSHFQLEKWETVFAGGQVGEAEGGGALSESSPIDFNLECPTPVTSLFDYDKFKPSESIP